MRALITGANGFAAKYLRTELKDNGYEVLGVDITDSDYSEKLDIMDNEGVSGYISRNKPDVIFHLAGFTSVAESWKNPQLNFALNIIGSTNLLEAIRNHSKETKIVLIGSSDQYGRLESGSTRISESTPMNPVSPYAISKKTQEEIGRIYASIYGMSVFMTRTFNYIGVGQRSGFVITDFAEGIVRAEGSDDRSMKVGNLSSTRCFADVRDVVKAYRLIVENGVPGRVYNVGADKIYSIEQILEKMLCLAKCDIAVKSDSNKLRAFDTSCAVCDASLLKKDTGWSPSFSIEATLEEILEDMRKKQEASVRGE